MSSTVCAGLRCDAPPAAASLFSPDAPHTPVQSPIDEPSSPRALTSPTVALRPPTESAAAPAAAAPHTHAWSPMSYLRYPAAQQPSYTPHAASFPLPPPPAAQAASPSTAAADLPVSRDAALSPPPTPASAPASFAAALASVRAQGPVVSAPGVVALRQRLADAALGRAFLLQAGDCAERVHADTTPGAATAALRRQLRVIAQMAAVLRVRARVPVVAVGRIAGQYAKPRSNDWETVSAGAGADVAARLPVFRGDSINGFTPTATARAHDPARLLAAHAQSCATARRIERVAPTAPVPAVKGADTVVLAAGAGQEGDMRSVRELLQLCCHGVGCSQCGFDVESDAEADNADADTGNDAAVVADATAAVHGGVFGRHCEAQRDYRALVSRHLEATGSGAETAGPLLLPPADEPVCFTSHEGLVLGYEAANLYATDGAEPGAETAADAGAGQAAAAPLCLSGHLVWIGERTRSLGQAHAEFFRGLGNPLAVKVGPTVTGPELGALLAVLDPAREPGRVTVITRLGAGRVSASLPPLVAAARMGGHTVLWCCDPMHGNTFTAPGGVKTRAYDAVLLEIQETAAVLAACGGFLGGVHLEVTGDRVTECLGGPCGVRVADLRRRYTSLCDPRLNYSQALAVAFAVADTLVALHKQSSAGDATGQSMS